MELHYINQKIETESIENRNKKNVVILNFPPSFHGSCQDPTTALKYKPSILDDSSNVLISHHVKKSHQEHENIYIYIYE